MKRFTYLLVLLILLLNSCDKRLDKIPNDFIGNFYDKSGLEYWAYGMQSNFFIVDCQFWDYEKIKSEGNKLSLWLRNNGATKRIDIVKTDSLNFDFIENDKTIHCLKKADSIKRIAKNNSFSMDTGTVVIRGYIINAKKYLKTDSKVEFIFCNEIVSNTTSEYADIDSFGRFEIKIKVLHAASCLVKYRNNLKEIFVSPDDQLLFSTNADNFNDFDFMGSHSDVCYDILRLSEALQSVENQKQYNASFAKDTSEFKDDRNSIKQQKDKFLENYLNINSCSEAFRIWSTKNYQNEYYRDLMRYSWCRFGKGSDKPMTYKEPYFSFIDSIDLNDSLAPMSYGYLFFSMELYNKLNYRNGIHMNSDESKTLYNKKKEELTNNPKYTKDEIKVELAHFLVDKDIDIILSNKYSRFRDLRLTKLLSEYIRGRVYNFIDYAYNRIETEIRYKPYLNSITEYYNNFKKQEEAFINTPIAVMKSSGKGDELLKEIVQKHSNRVIVLDFWFTGCSACRNDFVSMNKFKKDLISEDIDFVYLCYSSIENDWKNVLKEYKIQGDHYLLTSDQFSYFSKMFDINSAPSYILINKVGRIVNSNFRPPMEPNSYLSALKNNLMK